MEIATQEFMTYLTFGTFIGQVIFISLFLSKQWRSRRNALLSTYPEHEYPNLYAQSFATEQSRLTQRKQLDHLIAVSGFVIIAYSLIGRTAIEQVSQIMIYFAAIQLIPLALSAFWCQKNSQLLALSAKPAKRTASLKVQRLSNFVSGQHLIMAFSTYAISCGYGFYIYQQNLWQEKSFHALLLILLSTIMVSILVFMLYKNIYGKKKDHYIKNEDRLKKLAKNSQYLVKMITFYSIFILILSLIRSYQLDATFTNIFTSLFFQAVILSSNAPATPIDYQVYKE